MVGVNQVFEVPSFNHEKRFCHIKSFFLQCLPKHIFSWTKCQCLYHFWLSLTPNLAWLVYCVKRAIRRKI